MDTFKAIKIMLDEAHTTRLEADMKAAGTDSVQAYIRWKLFDEEIPKASQELFSMDEAVRRALCLEEGTTFTLPDLFKEEEWLQLPSPKMAGVLGRRFFRTVEDMEEIQYIPDRKRHRQTLYRRVRAEKEEK